MKSILKSIASLISLLLLVVVGYALTNLVLNRQPTTPIVKPTPQSIPPIAQASRPTAQIARPSARAAQPTARSWLAWATNRSPGAHVLSTPFVANVSRIGINTGGNDNVGPGDFMANMFDNPGFEPITETHLIVVGKDATSGSLTDASDPSKGGGYAPTKYPDGFWNGGKASVRTGAAAGDQFAIISYSSNGSYTFGSCADGTGNPINCPTLATGVAVIVALTGTKLSGGIQTGGGGVGNWYTKDRDCSYSTSQVYDGNGSLRCSTADGGNHVVSYNWDLSSSKGGVCSSDNVTPCTADHQEADCGGGACLLAPQSGPWHPVKGPFEIAFYALGSNTSSGRPQVTVRLNRDNGTKMSHTFDLINNGAWHQYVYSFIGDDSGWRGGQHLAQLDFSFISTNGAPEDGAAIYIDDAYLGKQTAATTGFRDEFTSTLRAIKPGSIRLMEGGTMAADRVSLEGLKGCIPGQGSGPDARGSCDFQHGPANAGNTYGGQWTYSSADLYPLANQLNASPWFSISNSFSDADLRTFIDNACTALAAYSNIPSIWIEQSNEEWNVGSPSYGIRYGSGNLGKLGYGEEALRNFSVMSAEATNRCQPLAGKIHYVLGEQSCNSGVVGAEIAAGKAAGYPLPNTSQYGTDGALYYGGPGNSLPSKSGSLHEQAAAYAAAFFSFLLPYLGPPGKGCINNGYYSDYGAGVIGSNNTFSIYEVGPTAYNGPGTMEQGYLSQAGYPSAGWMADSWLTTQRLGRTPSQNEFTMVQTEYGVAPIWGVVHDLDSDFGPRFPHLRSIAIGEEVVNSAIQQGGTLFGVDGGPESVVVNPYNSNSSGTGAWSAAMVNTTGSPVAYSLTFPPTGAPPTICQATINVNGITDNAEDSNKVSVGSCTNFSCSSRTCAVTLQPYQVVAMIRR
jgi:hypothetical protein